MQALPSVCGPQRTPRDSTRWYSVQGKEFWAFRKMQWALQIPRKRTGRAHYLPASDWGFTSYTNQAWPKIRSCKIPSQVSKMVFDATKPNIFDTAHGSQAELDLPCPHPHPPMHDFRFFHTVTRTPARDRKEDVMMMCEQSSFHS